MLYTKREAMFGPKLMRELERVIPAQGMSTPSGWTTSTPWTTSKRASTCAPTPSATRSSSSGMESGEMFNAMVDLIREDTIKMLLTVQVRVTAQPAQPAPQQPAQAPADAAPEKK